MSFLLSFIAILSFTLVHIIWSVILLFKKDSNKQRHKIAYNIDVCANLIYKDFWNTLLSKNGYNFGKLGETLSSVLGKKQKEKSLTFLGWFLLYVINFLDFSTWFKGGHCYYYIQEAHEIETFIHNSK